jgi:hypothetical protein
MADKKISALTASTTPLAGGEVLPIVQSGATVKVSVDNLTAGRSVALKNATASDTAAAPFYRALNGTPALSATAELQLDTTNSFSGFSKVYVKNESQTPGNSAADLLLGVNDNGGGAPYTAVRIKGIGGDVQVTTGNLVIGTSGKGIDFSADPSAAGMTSELLDDYEEGTWTPTLVGTTTDPTVTYSLQRGVYTKVGRLVTVTVYMGWSAFAGGSGNVGFGGLPFPVEGAVGAGSSGAVGYFDGFTLSVGRTSVGLFASPSTSYCVPTCFGSAVSTQYIPVGSVAASGLVAYQMTYFT